MAGDFLVAREVVFRDSDSRSFKGTRFVSATSPTLIGADSGQSGEHGLRMAQALNRMIRVANNYYALSTHRGIYHLNQSGSAWPSGAADNEWSVSSSDPGVCAMNSTNDVPVIHWNDVSYYNRQAHTGIHMVMIPDSEGVKKPHLVALYMDADTPNEIDGYWRACTLDLSDPDGDWTVSDRLSGPNLEANFNQGRGCSQASEVLWNNQICMVGVNGWWTGSGSNAAHLIMYDPTTGSLSSINLKDSVSALTRDHHAPHLAVWQNKLYVIALSNQSNSRWQLYEVQGSSLANPEGSAVILTDTGEDVGGAGTSSAEQRSRRCASYTKSGKLYCCVLVRDGGNDKFNLVEVDTDFTVTDHTSDLPSAMTGNLTGDSSRVVFCADPATTLGQETIYCYFNTSWDVANESGSAGSLTVYEVADAGSSWTSLGSAGDGGDALPNTGACATGGERIDIQDQLKILQTGQEKVLGGVKIYFKAWGDPGNADKKVKVWHDPNQGRPITQGTLRGSATGGSTSRNGNQIENVDADGVTEYSLIWDFKSDGYTEASLSAWALSIELDS